jgi:hypothetical protein
MWLPLVPARYLIGSLSYSLILKKEAVLSSEIHELLWDTQRDMPDDITLYWNPYVYQQLYVRFSEISF